MKISVCSWGLGIWVSSTNFQKNNKGWPQQPPTERVPNISEKLDFWGSNPQQGTCVVHFGGKDDQTIRIRKFFEKKRLLRLLRPARLQRTLRSMRLQRFLRPEKSLLRTAESSRFLSLVIWGLKSLYFDGLKKIYFYRIMLNFSIFSVRGCWCQPMLLFWELVDKGSSNYGWPTVQT